MLPNLSLLSNAFAESYCVIDKEDAHRAQFRLATHFLHTVEFRVVCGIYEFCTYTYTVFHKKIKRDNYINVLGLRMCSVFVRVYELLCSFLTI